MINRKRKGISGLLQRLAYSLKARLLFVITIGALAGIAVFILLKTSITMNIDNYYGNEENRIATEKHYIEDLQTYIDKNGLSSSDNDSIKVWLEQRKYVYLFVYKDDEFFYAGDVMDPEEEVGGVTVEYPTFEQIRDYAESNDLHTLTMSDGTLLVSIADFTKYFYYDVANLAAVASAIVVLAAIVIVYFYDITRRLSLLAGDVRIVSEVDMNHAIAPRGNDELAALSENVEKMRSGILDNLKREREARDANTELITAMSHDIRTPLTVLLGYIDVMKMQAEDETMRDYIAAAEATSLRLKELSDDMFKYFLLYGNGEGEVELMEYSAKTIIDQIFSEHTLYLKENGIDIEALGETELPQGAVIRTDAPKLMRIVDNVYSNIVKYADRSHPVRTVAVFGSGAVSIRFENVTDKSRCAAESNGIGLRSASRLAEMIGVGFRLESESNRFTAEISIPVELPHGSARD